MASPTDELPDDVPVSHPEGAAKHAKNEVDRREFRNGILWLVAGLVIAVLMGGLIYAIQTGTTNGNVATANGRQLTDLRDDVRALRAQVLECKDKPPNSPGCKVPVVPEPTEQPIAPETLAPKIIQGKQGKTGATGLQGPGPSPEQVQTAITVYCAGGRCDGKNPTVAQVASAVAAYCSARSNCTPKPTPGPVGPSGTPGKDGQNATGEMVMAAVNAYCENRPGGSCDGRDGKEGEPGSPGSPGAQGSPGVAGRGILDQHCDTETQEIQFKYSDDPNKWVPLEGSDCVADPLPPSPTGTP